MDKRFIGPQQLLEDAFVLAWQVYESGFRPDYVIGVWRGGTPVGIAVHELLHVLGVEADHAAIRSRSYSGIGRRDDRVEVSGLEYLTGRVRAGDGLLLVDDVHDTGLSLAMIVGELRRSTGLAGLDIRTATPYFKPGNNRCATPPDYFLHQTDDWLVFPHELAGLSPEELRANKPELAPLMEQLTAKLAANTPR